MNISELSLPQYFKDHYAKYSFLNPIQEKAVNAGLLNQKSLLICAPTASGKTFVASMAIANTHGTGKAIYLVPLKALANEKYKEYRKLLEKSEYKVNMATGDVDSDSPHLSQYDLLILTTEKLDSLLRHKTPWIKDVKLVVVDEIHLLNDPTRGPTLEILLTLLKTMIKPQIIGLSATIGNPKELADWLEAELVQDSWRPVELKQGIYDGNKTEFYEKP
ncbi:MAG: DEAD/DEAH box helicase [archaeon]|nr:DEAD/DEAH box helicase [archaeon]